MITRKTVIDNHEIKRSLFGKVTINGQKTPLRYHEAVRVVKEPSNPANCRSMWDRTKQEWVPT